MEHEDLIISYFESNLTPQEKVLFDNLMKTDPIFEERVTFEEKIKKTITLEERKALKLELQALENEKWGKKTTKKQWLYIAASIIVLLGISMFFVNQGNSSEKLYASYFEPYPNTVAPVVRSTSQKDIKNDAFSAYELGNYKKASQLFSELSQQTEEEYALFYNAMSLMMTDEIEQATLILADTSWNEEYSGKSTWYLALCYLKQKETQKSKKLLQDIISTNSYNSDKAAKLLQKIN